MSPVEHDPQSTAGLSAPWLSLVIPAFNEHGNIRPLYEEIVRALASLGRAYEILFIDDGSTDGTSEAIDALARQDPAVRAVHFESNAGQSAGFEAGFRLARGAVFITLDADMQNDPNDIPALLTTLETTRAGAVIGVRVGRRDSWLRRVSSRIGNFVRNALTKDHVTDTGCSLKVYRREALSNVKMFRGMHRFLPTLIRAEGFEVVEAAVNHRPRAHGTSKYGIANRALSGLMDVLAVRWMRERALHYTIRKGDGS